MFSRCKRLSVLLLGAALMLGASAAEAKMRRQALSIVVPAGATDSSAYTIACEGTIRLARVYGAAHTLALTADAGDPFGTMTSPVWVRRGGDSARAPGS